MARLVVHNGDDAGLHSFLNEELALSFASAFASAGARCDVFLSDMVLIYHPAQFGIGTIHKLYDYEPVPDIV